MSQALALFYNLCDVANLLEEWRDTFPLCSDDWCVATDLLGALDQSIDLLVRSDGLDEMEEEGNHLGP